MPPKGKGKLATRKGGMVTGNKKALRESQSYPRGFGEAVADTFIAAAEFANPRVCSVPSFVERKKLKKRHLLKKPASC